MGSFPKLRFCTTWFVRLYFQTRSSGSERIPREGPFIVAANHASFLDPYLIGFTSLERQVGFMAKAELFRIPLFGRLIRSLGAFPVSRGSGDREAVRRFYDFLHSGKPLVIFVEGTRTRDGRLLPPKKGSGMLIYNARVPVIPAYIDGTFACWPKGKVFPRPGKTSVSYGPAVPLEDLYGEKPEKSTYSKIAARVMEKIAALRPSAIPAGD
jgi:1-acyl-sn-glycerol-3-phosphate acyltransferase